jgi:hypothetical protein
MLEYIACRNTIVIRYLQYSRKYEQVPILVDNATGYIILAQRMEIIIAPLKNI